MTAQSFSMPPASWLEDGNPICNVEEIRRRAYELYEQRGRTDGHDAEDWLHAEAETIRLRRLLDLLC